MVTLGEKTQALLFLVLLLLVSSLSIHIGLSQLDDDVADDHWTKFFQYKNDTVNRATGYFTVVVSSGITLFGVLALFYIASDAWKGKKWGSMRSGGR